MTGRLLLLVRHGATDQSDQRRYLGQTDVALNDHGRDQARRLHDWLAAQPIDGAFCSDLSRSRETAEIIVSGRDITVVARRDLREIAMGAWENRPFAEIAAQFPEDVRARGRDIAHFRVAGGESFADCRDRGNAAVADILRTVAGNILIVGHAGCNRAVLCGLLGVPLANLFQLGQNPGCLNIIRYCGHDRETAPRLDLLNFVPWRTERPPFAELQAP